MPIFRVNQLLKNAYQRQGGKMKNSSIKFQKTQNNSGKNSLSGLFRLYFHLQSVHHAASPEERIVIGKHIKKLQSTLSDKKWDESILKQL